MKFLSHHDLQQRVKLLPLDFKKPWWQLIRAQQYLFVLICAITILYTVFWSLIPILIALVLERGTMLSCVLFFLVWLIIDACSTYSHQLNIQFQLQCVHSIYYNAHKRLLTLDPQYHVHRSSGSILGKIERGARGYEDLLDQITFEFIPLSVSLITIIAVLVKFSVVLAGIVLVACAALVMVSYYFAQYASRVWESNFLATDDAFKQTAVENLAQIGLIRAVFASDYMHRKITKRVAANMGTEGTVWLSYITTTFVFDLFYLATVFCVMGTAVWKVRAGEVAVSSAVAMVLAYVYNSIEILRLIKPLRRYIRGWSAVKDLFTFMRTFGMQTYPVLTDKHEPLAQSNSIVLDVSALSFQYTSVAVFQNHSFHLEGARDGARKLYGVIGPSGCGKSTFFAILAGQLKPILGTVMLNGIDVYKVGDAVRRELIALQGQAATHLRGTVAYNLTFGLPEDHGLSEAYLVGVVEHVGLLPVLPNGLTTMLGEGGLNLSGGQRQRLNFASLYIRAQYYKPLLLLIDEPTSSLDQISEAAITKMILELSEHALTLVIAHRLKTVEKATGLIDFSLLSKEQEIVVYTPQELRKRSVYYQQLMQGAVELDA
jgi:ABC-type multidrug transport system fused ATPase/permease subunit